MIIDYKFTYHKIMNVVLIECGVNHFHLQIADDLEKDTEYEFRVIAKNKAGKGDPSRSSETVLTKPKAGLH